MAGTELSKALQHVAERSSVVTSFLASVEADQVSLDWLETPEIDASAIMSDLGDLGVLSVPKFDSRLRCLRRREMARIIYRDQIGRSDLVETTRDLSRLADICLEQALNFHFQRLKLEWGEPTRKGHSQNLCVLALGKLGAYELNLSSDIDLIFFFETSGDLPSGKSYQEFYLRLAQNLIRSLDAVTADGFVFRVDMRLRPYGDSGALVLSRAAMEKYFLEQGRDWERYAFIKARAVAGDTSAGEQFLKWLEPFVYRQHIDYSALESLRSMKQMIRQEVEKRSQDDIKLGSGGIREIEFIVQSQQLIWGGRFPKLRQRRLLDTLAVLVGDGLLPSLEETKLRRAYVFLRDTEHVIQAENDRQTHALPSSPSSQFNLATALGYEDYQTFCARLMEHREAVSSIFDELISTSELDRDDLLEGDLTWSRIWEDPENSLEYIIAAGFQQTDQVCQSIAALKHDQGDFEPVVIERLANLMPTLMKLASRELEADQTLFRLLDLIAAIQRRSTYIAFLNENLTALMKVVRLCAMSGYVAAELKRYPVLLYELNEGHLAQSNNLPAISVDPFQSQEAGAGDFEEQMDQLRVARHGSSLKVAALELLGDLTIMKASDALTRVAELALDHALKLALEYMTDRHGLPSVSGCEPVAPDFGVIAYGKLGSYELSYDSDLDLVFVAGELVDGETSGPRPIHNRVYYQRLGQRLVHILSTMTRFGRLYQVDLRLRPDGNSGPLVIGMTTYERYLDKSAWVWEQQAIVRARMICGSDRLKTRFAEIRTRVIRKSRDTAQLNSQVREMREKMRASRAQKDLKHAPGALIDIEFLVQFFVLKGAAHCPQMVLWTDNVRLIDELERLGHLDASEAGLLQEAYLHFRGIAHLEWLGRGMANKDSIDALRAKIIGIWNKYL